MNTLQKLFLRSISGIAFARFAAGVALVPPGVAAEPAPKFRWVQNTFEDFSLGTPDAAGADLFVTRRGTIRTTHRFDLNGDRYLELDRFEVTIQQARDRTAAICSPHENHPPARPARHGDDLPTASPPGPAYPT